MTWVLSWKYRAVAHLRFGLALHAGLETQPRAAALIPPLTEAREALARGAVSVEERIADWIRARASLNAARLALLVEVSETASAAAIADRAGGNAKQILFPPSGLNELGSLWGQRLARRAGELLARLTDAVTEGMEALRSRCEPGLRASYERYVTALAARDAAIAAVQAAQQQEKLLRQAFVEAVVVVQAGLAGLFPRQHALIESIWPPRRKRRRGRKVDEVEELFDEDGVLDDEDADEDADADAA